MYKSRVVYCSMLHLAVLIDLIFHLYLSIAVVSAAPATAPFQTGQVVYDWVSQPAQSRQGAVYTGVTYPPSTPTTKNIYLLRLSSLDQNDHSTDIAMQHIRKNPAILPNHNIVIVRRNTNYALGQSMRAAFQVLGEATKEAELAPNNPTQNSMLATPRKYAAVLGPDFVIEILSIAEEVPVFNLMTISTHLSTFQLKDTERFPNTFRLGPKDRDYNIATMNLVKQALQATKIGITYIDSQYSKDRVTDFQSYMADLGYSATAADDAHTLEITYTLTFKSQNDDSIKAAGAGMASHTDVPFNILIDFGFNLPQLACWATQQIDPDTGKSAVYFDTNAFIVAGPYVQSAFYQLQPGVKSNITCTDQQMYDVFIGTFMVTSYVFGGLDTDNAIGDGDTLTLGDFKTAVSAAAVVDGGVSKFNNIGLPAISGYSYYNFDLIYTIVKALDTVQTNLALSSTYVPGLTDLDQLNSPTMTYSSTTFKAFTDKLLDVLLQTNITKGMTGRVTFDQNNDRIAELDVFQMQAGGGTTLKKVKVGHYTAASDTWQYSPELVHYGTANDKPPSEQQADNTGAIAGGAGGGGGAVLILVIAYLLYRRSVANKELYQTNWLIPWNAIQTGKRASAGGAENAQRQTQQSMRSTQQSQDTKSMQSKRSSAGTKNTNSLGSFSVDMYEKHFAIVNELEKVWMKEFEHPMKVTAYSTPYQLNVYFPTARVLFKIGADNLAKFIGITMPTRDESSYSYVLFRFMPKNSLAHLLGNDAIELADDFKCSLLRDLFAGVTQLSNTPLEAHGFLHAQNVVVDSRFTAFITDYGVAFAHEPAEFQALTIQMVNSLENGFVQKLFYRAPELLRQGLPPHGTKKGDVYALGVLAAQILTRKPPFRMPIDENDKKTPAIRSQLFDIILGTLPLQRPDMSAYPDHHIKKHIEELWLEDPNLRPEPQTVMKALKKIPTFFSGSILDNLIKRLETYAENLERTINERTQEVNDEKFKTEQLLYQILPHSVAEALKAGKAVMPEAFPMVTIYFSDIIGFTNLVSSSQPLQIVALLNGVYSLFDGCIGLFDAYKVETIGDAYMVVSGLPDRNGDMHSAEIGRLALSLLGSVKSFKVPHKPAERLHMRIGMNSGGVVAGVVGLIMPRYCLFGDTVNTASRMESTSEADCIHCSEIVYEHMQQHFAGSFTFELRGELPVKGKGVMKTYWLLSTTMPLHVVQSGGAQVEPIRIFSARQSFA